MATRTRATIEEVFRLSAKGKRYEIVDGELAAMSPTNPQHGDVEMFAGTRLNNFVLPRRLGKVLGGEVLFRLDRSSRLARAADVAYVSRERWSGRQLDQGAFVGAPELAIEIVSPNDSAKDIQQKVEDWLGNGTLAVVLMFPDEERVVLWDANGAVSLHGDDELNLDPALPGFRCRVRELFPPSLEDDAPESAP